MQRIKDRKVGTEPPKRPQSAYLIFQKEKREEILKRQPDKKVTAVVSEIAAMWRALSKEDTVPYKDLARKDRDRYEKEIKDLTEMSGNLKKPKKCLSAYMIFVKETRPRIVIDYPNLGALDVMKKVGEEWQRLQKLPDGIEEFKEKAKADKVRYLRE
mmetsp:Transcript_37127/g.56967  ORF Transcript_37127/g.56967 Transcript_37127/m.56967 type:complete len:157 (-) Transcript_37127:2626-3096(-)